MTIEIIGGYLANSIAIMSDAAHLLSDFLGFIISIISIVISRKKATNEMSFGFHRAEIIGALVSVTLIWGLTLWLLYEATMRIISPPEVDGFIMLVVAVIGFLFNLIMGLVLAYQGVGHSHALHSHGGHDHGHEHGGHDHAHGHAHDDEHSSHQGVDLASDAHSHSHSHGHGHNDLENVNLRAALIHVIGDALQNVGVIIAGAIIYFWPNLSIADPICTFVFSIIVGYTTIRILRDCINVLMEGSPLDFDLEALEQDLNALPGVIEVHDLHVWSLSLGKLSLSCHLSSDTPQITSRKARKLIKNKYKISHSTIQVEDKNNKFDCKHDLHQ
jgi:zinc transporter 2